MFAPSFSSVLSVSKERFHRIATTEWGRGNDGGTVVCVHGLTRQGRDFDWLARALAERGRRVVCPDLVGRGRSDRLKDPHDYGLPQYVTDMAVLIASCGVSEIDYVGTSLGGMIGILLAGRDNAPIRRLVINDIGPHIEARAAMRIGEYVSKAPVGFPTFDDAVGYFRTVLAPFGDLTDAQWRHMAEHSLERTAEGRMLRFDRKMTWAFRGPWHESPELWRAWANIKCPIARRDVGLGESGDVPEDGRPQPAGAGCGDPGLRARAGSHGPRAGGVGGGAVGGDGCGCGRSCGGSRRGGLL